jgi:AcrR family transcriptional regulator
MKAPSGAGKRKAEQVMASARTLFLERGFSDTSVDDIASRAGVSKPTVYSHFGDKRGLFIAFIREEVEALAGTIVTVGNAGDAPRAGLERFGRAYLDIVLSPNAQALFRVVLAESAKFPEIGAAFHATTIGRSARLLSERFSEWVAQGALDIDDFDLAGKRFLALCRADLHYKVLFGVVPDIPDAQRAAHVTKTVDAFLRIYGGPAGAGSE